MSGLRASVRYKGTPTSCSFCGNVKFSLEPKAPIDEIHVFALSEENIPEVHSFLADKDGFEALANILSTSEGVFDVVKGRKIKTGVATVVSVMVDGERVEDWRYSDREGLTHG